MLSKKSIASIMLFAGTMSLPLASQAAQPGFYIGGSIGQGDDVVLDQTSSAYKIFGGFNFNQFLGMEIAYVNLGSNYCCDNLGSRFTQDGGAFDVVGHLPIGPYVDVFGKVGIYNWTVSSNDYYYYSNAYTSGSSSNYGFGLEAEVSPRLWVRGEYQKFKDVAGGDVNLASVGMSYHF